MKKVITMSNDEYTLVNTSDRRTELNVTFSKRVCIKFIQDPSSYEEICSGCRCKRENHAYVEDENWNPGESEDTYWDYRTCTVTKPTDAYGELQFPGSIFKSAKFIRVEIDTDVRHLIQLLYHSKGWNLQPPKLIISVTGDSAKFNLSTDSRKAFKRGLAKAAGSTGSWIITGGTEHGVMRLVDEAVAKERRKRGRDLVVLGIVSWGVVALRDLMIINQDPDDEQFNRSDKFNSNKTKNIVSYSKENFEAIDNSVFLCPNHNHFIFVDDGSQNEFGKEIEFRARLESELSKGLSLEYYQKKCSPKLKKFAAADPSQMAGRIINPQTYLSFTSRIDGVPTILVVVQGGRGTLRTVYERLIRKMPILVLIGSKGSADLIAKACSVKSEDRYPDLVKDSEIVERFRSDSSIYDQKLGEVLNWLKFIVDQLPNNLINFHNLDRKDVSQDMEISILKALINAHPKKYFQNMRFALMWDRLDIAKMFILTGNEEFTFRELSYLMESALIENKPKFVDTILESGLNLRTFMTLARLRYLFNSPKMQASIKKSPMFRLLTRFLKNSQIKNISIENLHELLAEDLLDDFVPEFLTIEKGQIGYSVAMRREDGDEDDDYFELDENNTEIILQAILEKREGSPLNFPELNLFLWALLLNRIEIAKIFWLVGEHHVSTALFAYYLLKTMSERLSDLEDDLMAKANEFEEMACDIITSIDNTTLDVINHAILVRKIPGYNLTCLELAVKAGSLKFISLPTVQNLLNDIWIGNIEIEHDLQGSLKYLLSCSSYGLLAPFLLKPKPSLPEMLEIVDEIGIEKTIEAFNCADNISNLDFDSQDEATFYNAYGERKRKISYLSRLKHFISSPKTCFLFETLFFILFLILFSYVLLCEFEFVDEPENSISKATKTESTITTSTISILMTFYQNQSDSINNSSTHALDQKDNLKGHSSYRNFPSLAEFILALWVLAYLIDEIIQIVISKFKRTIKSRFAVYFSSQWNILDILGCVVFAIGFTVRMIASFRNDESFFVTARIIYALDLSIWYLRLLHVSMVLKTLGPKLIMIRKMLQDLSFFIVILLIFVILFGVTTQATMYPGNRLNFELLKKIINKAYWPIYGDIRLLDELNSDEESCSASSSCPSAVGTLYSYALLILYMVFANVLLLNLLIAMFSFRFNVVQENTDTIWKFQQYELVYEYRDSYAFPPPISLISYLIMGVSLIFSKNSKLFSNFYLASSNESKTLEYASSLERQYAEEYTWSKKNDQKETIENQLRATSAKLESLEIKMNELFKKQLK